MNEQIDLTPLLSPPLEPAPKLSMGQIFKKYGIPLLILLLVILSLFFYFKKPRKPIDPNEKPPQNK